MKILRFIAVLSLLLTVPYFAHAATMVFEDGFEDGQVNDEWSCAGNCPTAETVIIHEGQFSSKAYLDRTLSVPYRTEMALNPSYPYFSVGTEYWMGFSLYQKDWATDFSSEIISQMHYRPSTWDCGITGSALANNPWNISVTNNKISFYAFGNTVTHTRDVASNVWQDIVVHFKISTGSDGFVKFYYDGVLVGSDAGQNYHTQDSCGQPLLGAFFKAGIYKWDWKSGRPATDTTQRTAYFDNYRIATGSGGFDLVSPTGAGAEDPCAPSTTQGIDITVSTCDGVNYPAEVLDSIFAGDSRWSGDGDGAWIAFDFGSNKTINGAKIAFYQGDARSYNFDIQSSTDGAAWSNVLTGVNSSGTSLAFETFTFPEVTARHIRYVGHMNSVNNWNSLTEISFDEKCHLWNSATPLNGIPVGYSVPHDVFDNNLYIQVGCGMVDSTKTTATATVNLPGTTNYVAYSTYFVSKNETPWVSQLLVGQAHPESSAWLTGPDPVEITGVSFLDINYIAFYICRDVDTTPKCGYRDSSGSAETSELWNLQRFGN